MPLAGLPHANKYDQKDSPAEKEMRVRTREHVRNEGSRRFKSAPLHHPVPQVSDLSDNRSEIRPFARNLGLTHGLGDRLQRRQSGGYGKTYPAIDFDRSMDVRPHFAFIDRPKLRGTQEHTPARLTPPRARSRATSRCSACNHIGARALSCPPTRSSSKRSATSLGFILIRRTTRWYCAWMRRARCRPWSAPNQCCQWGSVMSRE